MRRAFAQTHRARVSLMLALIAALVILGTSAMNASAQPPAPSLKVEPLTGLTTFPDDIDAKFGIKLKGQHQGGKHIVHVDHPNNVLMVKITYDDGVIAPWHTHPGPALVTITKGSLTVTHAMDCVDREYVAGQGFIDMGHGNIHMARATGETVAYITFFEVPDSGQATIPATEPACGH